MKKWDDLTFISPLRISSDNNIMIRYIYTVQNRRTLGRFLGTSRNVCNVRKANGIMINRFDKLSLIQLRVLIFSAT